jgi:hypothetical protein
MPKTFAKGKVVKNKAPLVQADIKELGDTRLNPKEAIAREREDLLELAGKAKIWGQTELEDHERSAGPRLSWGELIRRIRDCNSSIQVLDSQGGSDVAIYVRKKRNEYDEQERDWTRPEFFWDHKYVTGMPKSDLPEYAHVTLDTSGLPLREIRGWRSVLIALVKTRAITYEQAIEKFGDPTFDRRSGRWFEQLREYRAM